MTSYGAACKHLELLSEKGSWTLNSINVKQSASGSKGAVTACVQYMHGSMFISVRECLHHMCVSQSDCMCLFCVCTYEMKVFQEVLGTYLDYWSGQKEFLIGIPNKEAESMIQRILGNTLDTAMDVMTSDE